MERYAKRDGAIEIDFTQRSKDGPGYSQKDKITQDFKIPSESGFGEHTAAILHGNYAAIQFNHRGVRTGGIARYIKGSLESITGERIDLLFSPVVRPHTLNQLYKDRASKISFSVHPLRITDDLAKANFALGTAARIRQRTGAEWVSISFSKGRRKRQAGNLEGVNEIVDGLMATGGDVLQSLILKTTDRSGRERKVNLVNSIEHNDILDSELVFTSGSRLTYNSRISFIRNSFRPWLLRNRDELSRHR